MIVQPIDTRPMFDQYLLELKEVKEGRRGHIPNLTRRAKEMGLQFGSLKVAAETMGLKVAKHGKYGYCVFK